MDTFYPTAASEQEQPKFVSLQDIATTREYSENSATNS
jgi:hypothetical protein